MFTDAMNGFYRLCVWALRLAYLNLLWLIFTLLGLLVFGIFPATTAVFSVMRKLMQTDRPLPIWKTFWSYYKRDFLQANLLGLILVVLAAVLSFDIYFISQTENAFLLLFYYPLLLLIFLFMLAMLYIFPVFTHYEVGVIKMLRNAFILMITHPLQTILMGTSVIAIYVSFRSFPGLIPLYHMSICAFVLMKISYRSFVKVDEKQASLS